MNAAKRLVSLLALGVPSVVAAQPAAHLTLSWNSPPGCPTAEDVQARVNALLGGSTSASTVADVNATGQVERSGGGFRLLLTMGVGSIPSSRVIEARTCDELAGAAAIALALLARSTAEAASEPVVDGSVTDASTASAPPAAPPSATATRDKARRAQATDAVPSPLGVVIHAPVGVIGWGSLPAPGLGLGAAIGLRWKALHVTLAGELWQRQTHDLRGFSTRFGLQSGRVEACLTHAYGWLDLGPCVGGALQRLEGDGVGSDVFAARSRTALWFGGVGGLFASLRTPGVAPLRLFGDASVVVSPSRPRFVIDQLGTVHEPALAAPRLGLGCQWIF